MGAQDLFNDAGVEHCARRAPGAVSRGGRLAILVDTAGLSVGSARSERIRPAVVVGASIDWPEATVRAGGGWWAVRPSDRGRAGPPTDPLRHSPLFLRTTSMRSARQLRTEERYDDDRNRDSR